ncbi:MAG: hypothetical protein PHC41_02620 [Lachnospiraceae bacterium]|nr:hypothetical protein [Lachnospiraceae bacterium]MDD3615102.1 hypothetical protein [Lachnospiraceae bacterium]
MESQNPYEDLLHQFSPEKARFLSSIFSNRKLPNSNQLMPFLLMTMNNAKKKGITFTSQEQTQITEYFLEMQSPKDRDKYQQIFHLLKEIGNK